MKMLLYVFVLISTLSLCQSLAAADTHDSSAVSSPLAVLSDNHSHISKAGYHRIGSAAEWKKMWLEHLGLKEDTIYRTAMEVDFDRCMVIAIFGGDTENSCGFRVESVREKENTIVVEFANIGYQTGGPDGGGDRVTPYVFIVLPRSQKVVVLDETTHTRQGTDVTREVARLTAPRK